MSALRWFVPFAVVAGAAVLPMAGRAQWSQVHERLYLPAEHNWAFRNGYPAADRLFNAFDYGHAILYEVLWRGPGDAVTRLEEREYAYITSRLLVNPPRLPLEEAAVAPSYSRLVPEARAMFEWAHMLHRQAYDVLADDRLAAVAKEAAMRGVLAHYRSRADLRFSERPKGMGLMQEQPYSLAFRQRFPKFNGLIWAYHWLQVGLYEPLIAGDSPDAKRALVHAAVARFRQMLVDAPEGMPYVMPMTAAIAPSFAQRYPELAIIFDNLHSLHDAISDILANPSVPAGRKRFAILEAARRYRDDTTEVMTVAGWRRMSAMMGIENQGGPAVGFLAALPVPSVARGAVMSHDREGNMVGAGHAGHEAAPARPAADPHAGHVMPDAPADSAAVVAVAVSFHESLARGDSTAALASMDDEAELVSRAFTGSKAAWRSGRIAAEMAEERTILGRAADAVVVRGDRAWVSSTARRDASPEAVGPESIWDLVVLRRAGPGAPWRIVAVHRATRRGPS